jgi:hypothetical protein
MLNTMDNDLRDDEDDDNSTSTDSSKEALAKARTSLIAVGNANAIVSDDDFDVDTPFDFDDFDVASDRCCDIDDVMQVLQLLCGVVVERDQFDCVIGKIDDTNGVDAPTCRSRNGKDDDTRDANDIFWLPIFPLTFD